MMRSGSSSAKLTNHRLDRGLCQVVQYYGIFESNGAFSDVLNKTKQGVLNFKKQKCR